MDANIFNTFETAVQYLYTRQLFTKEFNDVMYSLQQIWPHKAMDLIHYEEWMIRIIPQYPSSIVLRLLHTYYDSYPLTSKIIQLHERYVVSKYEYEMIHFLYYKKPLFGLYLDAPKDFKESTLVHNALGKALRAHVRDEPYDLNQLTERERELYVQYLLLGKDVFLNQAYNISEEIELIL